MAFALVKRGDELEGSKENSAELVEWCAIWDAIEMFEEMEWLKGEELGPRVGGGRFLGGSPKIAIEVRVDDPEGEPVAAPGEAACGFVACHGDG